LEYSFSEQSPWILRGLCVLRGEALEGGASKAEGAEVFGKLKNDYRLEKT
jgi:hypothetical protein